MKGREDRDPADRVAAVDSARPSRSRDTAITALAAVATAAAEGLVAEKCAVADREGRAGIADGAPYATTAISTGPRPCLPVPPRARLERNVECATVMVEEAFGPTMP